MTCYTVEECGGMVQMIASCVAYFVCLEVSCKNADSACLDPGAESASCLALPYM